MGPVVMFESLDVVAQGDPDVKLSCNASVVMMDDERVLQICRESVAAVADALAGLTDWGLAGTRSGQYRHDLAADEVVTQHLLAAGLGVVSEESGEHELDRELIAVVDPVDGSTNASHGLPWFACSICVVDSDGPRLAVVQNLATGDEFWAARGAGAFKNGTRVTVGTPAALSEAIVGLNGLPDHHFGWRQFRALGAVALDLCSVASGGLDAYVDCTDSEHAPWDYLGGALLVTEAGGVVADADGRDMAVFGHSDRRTPVVASNQGLLDELLIHRAAMESKP